MLHHRLLVPLTVVPFAVGAVLTGTASAAPAPATTTTTTTGISSVTTSPDATAAVASVSIVKTAGPAHWSKASVSGKRTSATTCTPTTAAFSITNSTAVSQTIKVGGKAIGALPAHRKGYICGKGPKPFSQVFTLSSNAKARLVAHFL